MKKEAEAVFIIDNKNRACARGRIIGYEVFQGHVSTIKKPIIEVVEG